MTRLMTLLCLLCAWGVASFASAKNYALLIGNAAYQMAPLDNPVNDASDFAKVLKDIGFEVRVLTNQSQEAMMQAIRNFGEQIRNNDGIALFYFAGHGVQVEGENYLLPVGVPIRNEDEVKKNAVPANLVLRYMEEARNRANVVILDACRNNPFIKTRSFKSRGLAPMDAPSGSLIAFSTAPGTEALDGTDRNGLYTKHLMANVKVPGLTVEQVFKRTREAVELESERIAGRRQSPREESSLKGADLYFVPPPMAKGGADEAAIELAYWNSIAQSESSADYESYLAQYPNGKFAALARSRLEALRAKQTQVAKLDARTAQEPSASAKGGVFVEGGQRAATPATRASGGVVAATGGFKFSDHEPAAPMKAAEFLSISCRDAIRNKKAFIQLADSSGGGEAIRQALEAKLRSIGVKLVANRAGADFVVRGKVVGTQGVNRILGINEVDLTADFTLLLKNGNAVSSTSVYGASFAGSNRQQAIRAVWDEKSEEVIGRLFGDYCAD